MGYRFLGLYVGIVDNGVGRKSVTLLNHLLLHQMVLSLMGADYKHRQCPVGLDCHMYDCQEYGIVRVARQFILPRFLPQIAIVFASVASELAQDPLAHDNMLIQEALALEVIPCDDEDANGFLPEWHVGDLCEDH